MEKLTFSTRINAPKERVWDILWNDVTYPQWTSVFSEGSQASSDWKEGSKIQFTDGKGSGMTSKIARLIPNEFMSFQHLGEIKDGVEDFTTAEEKGWANGLENYTLRESEGGTDLIVELDALDEFNEYFQQTFPSAIEKIKALAEAPKISPFLWFDQQAEEAVTFYTSIFHGSKVGKMLKQNKAVVTVDFTLGGQSFAAINGGPQYKFNPSISFFVVCEKEAEIDLAWEKLSQGGKVLMALDKYPWSEKYGWVEDRYGLTWQLSFGKLAEVGQKFTPLLMFVGEQHGRAEEAMKFYSSIFKNSQVDGIMRYEAGEADPAEGTIKHAQFSLDGQKFMVMDSSAEHNFQFNEAVSFVISTETQHQTDYYWEKLSSGGGQESRCGWLKDKFGVSWQVVPTVLIKYLSEPSPLKANNVMQAMLKMRKIIIADLETAFKKG